MDRLTVDTEISFCDIAQYTSIPGGSFCESGYCDQRRVYERLREYERIGLEPEEMPTGRELANVYAAMLLLKQYQSVGTSDQFRALQEAEQKRREGCEFCRDHQNLIYYKRSDFVICPHCGRDLRGESHE